MIGAAFVCLFFHFLRVELVAPCASPPWRCDAFSSHILASFESNERKASYRERKTRKTKKYSTFVLCEVSLHLERFTAIRVDVISKAVDLGLKMKLSCTPPVPRNRVRSCLALRGERARSDWKHGVSCVEDGGHPPVFFPTPAGRVVSVRKVLSFADLPPLTFIH